ncbi:MAG: response regulator [Gemmatimonadales bacterium]
MSLPHVPPARPITVLVVDDEDMLRHVVCRGLGYEGFRTLEAHSGEDALHLVDVAPADLIDLVITDVVMSSMDGWELGRRLAQKRPGVPVLYISAYPPGDIFHRGPPSGGLPFLQKPFNAPELLAKIGDLLGDRIGGRPASPS